MVKLSIGARTAAAFATAALNLALPPTCAGCGREDVLLCDRCARPLRSRCAMPPGVPLGLRAEAPGSIAQLEWCASFTGPVRAALHELKYGGEQRLAGPLGEAIATRWRAAGVGGDLLCPVPVHAERERQRGYDQALLLAEAASGRLRMPMRRVLKRARNTRPQFDLGRKARLGNVADAFELRSPADRSFVVGRWIVLVDDVVTTGSTLAACAEALYLAGALAVSAVTVARER